MLYAQYHGPLMYASCTFFFGDFGRPEPRYAIATAAYAVQLVRRATETDLGKGLRNDLAVVVSAKKGKSGLQVHDEVVEELGLDCWPS
jgi:hypothetical protein